MSLKIAILKIIIFLIIILILTLMMFEVTIAPDSLGGHDGQT